MINAIKHRRAIREYLSQPLPEKQLQEILKAAAFSPSANAKYPWEIIVVKDLQTKELLSKTTPWSTFAKDADTILVIVGHEKESSEWVEDCSIVAEHIWLEAEEQGLGTCWIQIKNQGQAETSVKDILNIPEDLRVLCLMPLGIPAKKMEEHSESDIDKSKIKYEAYR